MIRHLNPSQNFKLNLKGAFTQSVVLCAVIRPRLGYLINKKTDHFTQRILPLCERYLKVADEGKQFKYIIQVRLIRER